MSRRRKSLKPGRRAPTGESRQALVDAGLAIVREEGDAKLSLRAAAQRAGLSDAIAHQLKWSGQKAGERKQVRAHFIAAIAERGFTEMHAQLERESGSGTAYVHALALRYVLFAHRNPSLYRVMFRPELGDRTDYPELAGVIAQSFDVFRNALVSVFKSERQSTTHTNALVLMLHGFSSELINGWMVGVRSQEQIRQATEDLVDCLL